MSILEQVFNKRVANKLMVDELCNGMTFEEINRNNINDIFNGLDQMKRFNANMSEDNKTNYDVSRYHVNENQKGEKQF